MVCHAKVKCLQIHGHVSRGQVYLIHPMNRTGAIAIRNLKGTLAANAHTPGFRRCDPYCPSVRMSSTGEFDKLEKVEGRSVAAEG
jgi:hypothetical protein